MANQERQLSALERQRQALELRKAGYAYHVIAAQLGYKDHSGAHHAVSVALRRTLQEPADELRRLELERMDAAWVAIYPQMKKGSLGAIDRGIRLMERRAKLLGLDAPIRQEHTGADGERLVADHIDIVVKHDT